MALPFTSTRTVFLQRNTRLFLFPLLQLSLPLWHGMRPNPPFLSPSNVILKPGGLLRWKVWLVKDARLLLLLTEVMKIARLTSPLLDAPRQSSPRPRLRHCRRLALLFHLNLTLNLCTLFFALSLALLPPLLTFPTVWFFKIAQVVPFESVEVFRKDPFLALYFSLSINDLPASLPSSVSCSVYADDLAIWSSSLSVPTAVEATQGALFQLERWSEYWSSSQSEKM